MTTTHDRHKHKQTYSNTLTKDKLGTQVERLPVTLSSSDAALAREFLQFAVEQINDTLVIAERNRSMLALLLEAYRDDAVALLERMRA